MIDPNMAECSAFLSYAHVNAKLARIVAGHLNTNGLAVWWDGQIDYGDRLADVIANALSDASVIIGLVSSDSLKSEWVMWELSQGLETGKTVILVLIDGALPEHLPPPFRLKRTIVIETVEADGALDELTNLVSNQLSFHSVDRVKMSAESKASHETAAQRRLAAATMEARRHTNDMRWKNETQGNSRISFHGLAMQSSSDAGNPFVSASENFAALLHDRDISLIVGSSQAGKIVSIGARNKNDLTVQVQRFNRPMSLCQRGNELYVAEYASITRFDRVLNPNYSQFTDTFRPTVTYHTGAIDVHEIAIDKNGKIWMAATQLNCLATLGNSHKLKPEWLPQTVETLVSEDRCHLNGLAMRKGEPAFVTTLGGGEFSEHWRSSLRDGGQVHCVKTGAIICDGLSMPHSPRFADGNLWVLNSGLGELGHINLNGDPKSAYVPLVSFPGFPRGLMIEDGIAFVGLSKPRYDHFTGLPLGDKLERSDTSPICGVHAIELKSGNLIGWIQFDAPILEVADICLLKGVGRPKILGIGQTETDQFISIEPIEHLRASNDVRTRKQ